MRQDRPHRVASFGGAFRSEPLAVAIAWVAIVLLTCGAFAGEKAVRVVSMRCPAPSASAEPNLHAANGRLYLTWLVHHDDRHTLQYAALENGRWTKPRTIAAGDSFFANWADFPSLIELSDGSLVAHWLWKSGADTYAYDVMLARSSNGTLWHPAIRPHHDGTQTEHGFASLIATGTGGADVIWLDGRDYATKEHGEAEMQLMCATFGTDGTTPERVLDARVCDCCPTAAVRTNSGLLAAYRDRSPNEVRDIYLVRRENDSWSAPYPLSEDGWRIAGCPVNGPALATNGQHVAAAWFTITDQQPSVRVAFSEDEGRTFSEYIQVDAGNALGRVDVVMLPDGSALVVWLESPPDADAEIRARRVGADRNLDASFVISSTSADRASGYPRIERVGSTLYFAWTQTEDESSGASRVRMARLEMQ